MFYEDASIGNKYLDLKKKLQIGGAHLHHSDDVVNEIIKTVDTNIRKNIRTITETMIELSQPDITRLNISGLGDENEISMGQYGTVYDLSPSFAIKKIKIIQSGRNITDDILKEIRMGYFVEYLNKEISLYSGNLAHFKDVTHFYLILKKFKSIDVLESNIKPECNLFDVAISLISQLYVLTKNLSTLTISHGDEKFDNLLFEDTRGILNNFEYSIGDTTYIIKNCGFRLRLIDWGETTEISSMNPLWNAAWLDAINKGIQGIKKGPDPNKSAPTTDYLVSVCKLIGDLGLSLEYEPFETKFRDFINGYATFTPRQKEQFKLDLLLSDQPDPTKIFNNIGEGKIDGLYETFDKLKKSTDDSFLSYDDKVDFDQIDFDELPRFRANKITATNN